MNHNLMLIQKQLTKINRIFRPYWEWEEVEHNMWGEVEDRDTFLKKAIEFTGDYKLYGKFMMRVVQEWPFSCEHNLTANQNRQAWIGHAACALALQCPEDIVREAWHHLSQEQQDLANREADKAIAFWENKKELNQVLF